LSIKNLRNYASDPHNLIHHQHKDLLILADNTINTRNELRYITHIGKVNSYTGVTHNDEADEGARSVVEGAKAPDRSFSTADLPVGGLRTLPQIRTHHPDKPPPSTKQRTYIMGSTR
jgi:hypothetical protein